MQYTHESMMHHTHVKLEKIIIKINLFHKMLINNSCDSKVERRSG